MMDAATLTRSWPPMAAWGAGLIQLALGAGMITGQDAASRAVGVLLVLTGAAGLGWGALRFAGRGLTARHAATAGLAVALAGMVATAPALAVDPARVSVFAVAGLITPALSATEAGRLAPGHGEHGLVDGNEVGHGH